MWIRIITVSSPRWLWANSKMNIGQNITPRPEGQVLDRTKRTITLVALLKLLKQL